MAAYQVIDLGPSFVAEGLNDAGVIVGWWRDPTQADPVRACLSDHGQVRILGTLGGKTSYATCISPSGWIAGTSRRADGRKHAFLYDGGQMRDLGVVYGSYSHATGVNDRGHVVGFSAIAPPADDALPSERAFLYDGVVMRNLGTLGGRSSWATAINARDEIVGWAETASGERHAFLHDGVQMQDLGASFGDEGSIATGVTDAGQVIGQLSQRGAYLLDGGRLFALGTNGGTTSRAVAINARRQIVGYGVVGRDHPDPRWRWRRRGFLWQDDTLIDLADLIMPDTDWDLSQPRAINARSQIVGVGHLRGESRAFLLHPDQAF